MVHNTTITFSKHYLVLGAKPLLAKRSDVFWSWPTGLHTSQEGFCQILSKSLRFRGWCLATWTFSSLLRFSMGWRSGDWLGHSRILMWVFLSHSFVALAVCFVSLSCWNTPYFGLIWPQHFHPVLLWIIGTLQTCCTYAFLSKGTLQELQDFSPSRRSVLPIVFLVTMVPAWDHWQDPPVQFWADSSPFSWSLKLHEVRSCTEPQSEGDILCFFHLWIIVPNIITFSPSCLAIVL